MAAAALRFAAGQGHIDGSELVDGEGAAHRLDPAESGEHSRQVVLRHPEHLEIEVLRGPSAQAIAHEAADDDGPAAARARRLGHRDGHVERSSRVGPGHAPIVSPRRNLTESVTVDTVDRLLSDLVAIDSVNPTLVPGAAGEAAIARRLVHEFEAIGLHVEVQEVAPGRPNVVATLDGRAPGRSLMLCGHIDTVGVAGMSAPFAPVVRDGRLHGRGAQDMKSGVAAMIDAVRVVAAGGGLAAGRVVVACVVDEEHSSIGADALVTRWRADAGVVTEPTDLDIAVAHKGFEWAQIDTVGRAAHGSRPAEGVDAILHMGRVLHGAAGTRHPAAGRPAASAPGPGVVARLAHRGRRRAEQLSRSLPAATGAAHPAGGSARRAGGSRSRASWRDWPPPTPPSAVAPRTLFGRPPYEVDHAHPLPVALTTTARAAGCRADTIGMSFWTDAAVLGAAGIPSVLFGPTGAGLHSADEWVDLASVRQCRDALAGLIRDWCR